MAPCLASRDRPFGRSGHPFRPDSVVSQDAELNRGECHHVNRLTSRTLLLALLIAGFILIVIGVLYLVTPMDALPSFLGGPRHGGFRPDARHTKRAAAALTLGVLTLTATGWLFARSVARLREHRYVRRGAPSFGFEDGGGLAMAEPTEGGGWRVSEETDAGGSR